MAALAASVACSGGSGTSKSAKLRASDAGVVAEQVIDAAGTSAGDPMFPTEITAGTAQIFFLEQPERGRHITEATVPPARTLTWTRHAYCELGATGMVCSKAPGVASSEHWRIGRAPRVVVAERRRGAARSGRLLLRRDAAGALTEVVALRRDGTVDWARSYEQPGVRYSERARSGSNQLAGCGFMKLRLDSDGRAAAITCLQWMLAPMSDARGVATTVLRRDAEGFVIERSRMNAKGKPDAGHDGVHRVRIERDGQGRPTVRRFFGTGGAPVASRDGGCTAEKTSYDRRGRTVGWRCLDAADKLVAARPDPMKRFAYDRRGCRISETLFDPNGAATSVDGVHGWQLRVDAACRPTRRRCIDTAGKPVACGVGGPAEIRYQRNHAGLVVRARHYNARGARTGDSELHVFELRYVYDDKGNEVETSCWNEDGAPVECSRTGYHAAVYTYDEIGRRVTSRFLDTERKRASNLGAFTRVNTYDNYDHVHHTQNLGSDNRPTEALGATTKRFLYDTNHRLFGVVLYDRKGDPARFRGCVTGRTCPGTPWHAVRVVRDATGRAVRNLYFDHERMLIYTYECSRARCWGRGD